MIRRFAAALFLFFSVLSATPLLASSEHWNMITSSHFFVLTDAGESRARQVALHLEQMRVTFAQLLSKDKIVTSEPLDVMALSGEEYGKAVPIRDGRATNMGGVFISGDDRNFIVINAEQEDGWRAVAHDYALMLLNYNYPPTQPWFDEGFAQYYAGLKFGNKDAAIGGDPDGSFVPLLNSSRWIPIPELFARKKLARCNDDDQQKLFCAESWMVMHYLINNERLPNVGIYLNSVMVQKTPIGQAVEKAFGMNAEEFQKTIQDYFHTHTQAGSGSAATPKLEHSIPLPMNEIGLASTFQEVLESRAHALVAEMMIRLPEHRDQAVKDINFLMNGDRTENSVEHRALAWMYIQDKNYAQARQELHDGAELKANDAWILYYSSLMKYREAQASGKSYQGLENMFQEMRAVIDWYPEFAEAYNMLGMARLDGGGLNSAIDAMRMAVQLAPRNPAYLLHLAEIEMAAKKWDPATALLEKLKTNDDAGVAQTATQDLTNLPYLKKYGILPQDSADAEQRAVYSHDYNEDNTPDEPAPPDKPKLDTRPIKYVKGTLLSVDCTKSPQAVLKVLAAGKKMEFHAADYKSMIVVGAGQTSCEWSHIPVAINYKAIGSTTGDVVSIELQ